MTEDELEAINKTIPRKTFYIDVGNMSAKDAQKAIDAALKKFKEEKIND